MPEGPSTLLTSLTAEQSIRLSMDMSVNRAVSSFYHKVSTITNPDLSEKWGCPSGYVLMQNHCYRARLQLKTMMAAERACNEEGAKLAEPSTKLHVSSSNFKKIYYMFLKYFLTPRKSI